MESESPSLKGPPAAQPSVQSGSVALGMFAALGTSAHSVTTRPVLSASHLPGARAVRDPPLSTAWKCIWGVCLCGFLWVYVVGEGAYKHPSQRGAGPWALGCGHQGLQSSLSVVPHALKAGLLQQTLSKGWSLGVWSGPLILPRGAPEGPS